jgi:beta-lactamase regulating signal transducer with metallopeptidase domain
MADWLATLIAMLVPVLGRALLNFVWQGVLIGLLAAIALELLRDARPQARYAVACLAMLACVLVPAAGVLQQLSGIASAPAATTFAPVSYVMDMVALPATDVAAWPLRIEEFLPDALLPLIVSLWAGGASVLSLRMALGVIWIRRLAATPQRPAHAAWQSRLDALAEHFGITRPVSLRLVDRIDSPASAGWLRPVVLLPSALIMRMPIDLIEALLAHELAHVRRHDYLVNLVQGVVEALLFYHPVTWWLSRRIRTEREHIADSLAATVTVAPHRLALALSELSDWRSESRQTDHAFPHLAQAAHGGQLMSRIQQLVQPGRRTTGGKVAFPLLGLAAACIALYAQAEVSTPHSVSIPAPVTTAIPTPSVTRGPVLQPRAVVAQVTRIAAHDTGDGYALVRKDRDGFSMSGSTDDVDAIKAARASIDSDFLWFRHGDKAYIVVDPATVSRAKDAWREVDRLSPQMEALGAQMEVHGDKLELLGGKMELLAAHHKISPAMETAAHRMEQLGKQQQGLAGQQMRLAADMMETADDARRSKLQAQMDALDEQMDALSEQMDQQSNVLDTESEQLEANQRPMEALGRQMEEASKPMEALGAQMEVLGKEQEKHVKAAEIELQKLVSAALAQGLAKPAPSPAGKQ